MKIKDKIIESFKLTECSKEQQDEIIRDFIEVIVEKTLIDSVNEMNDEELESAQKYEDIDKDNILETIENNKDNLDRFFVNFNKNLNEAIREF